MCTAAQLGARGTSAAAWQEATAESGRKYYYDAAHPEVTTWTRPPELDAPAASGGSGGSPAPAAALSEAAQDELAELRAQVQGDVGRCREM